MATPPALAPEKATPIAALTIVASSFALTLIAFLATTTAPLVIEALTLFLSQLRLTAPPAALTPEPAPPTARVIICEPKSKSNSGGKPSRLSPRIERLRSVPVGKTPAVTSTLPADELTAAASIVALTVLPTLVVAIAAPAAFVEAPAPPTASTNIVVLSAAFTWILLATSTSVSAPLILASAVINDSLTATTIPAALAPDPAPPPAATIMVSVLNATRSNLPSASTSAPFLISAVISLRIKFTAIEPPTALAPAPAPPMLTLVNIDAPWASTLTSPAASTVALSI